VTGTPVSATQDSTVPSVRVPVTVPLMVPLNGARGKVFVTVNVTSGLGLTGHGTLNLQRSSVVE